MPRLRLGPVSAPPNTRARLPAETSYKMSRGREHVHMGRTMRCFTTKFSLASHEVLSNLPPSLRGKITTQSTHTNKVHGFSLHQPRCNFNPPRLGSGPTRPRINPGNSPRGAHRRPPSPPSRPGLPTAPRRRPSPTAPTRFPSLRSRCRARPGQRGERQPARPPRSCG